MAQVRTAKGTNAVKTSGTSLTITGVAIDQGATLVVGLAYDNSQGPPTSVNFGNRLMKEVIKQQNLGSGFTSAIWVARTIRRSNSRDIVATWSGSIGARAMFATQITEAAPKDVQNSAQADATTSPATGAAVTTTVANTIHIAAFMANGPNNDTAATANLGHTIGQRIGTAGVPPISNVTLQETYEILTAIGDCRSSLTLTTARDCSACIVAFEPTQTYKIVDAYHRPWGSDTDADLAVFEVEDEDKALAFKVRIHSDIIETMTDTEVTEHVQACAAWHARKFIDGDDPVPPIDTVLETRLDTFVNDTVTV